VIWEGAEPHEGQVMVLPVSHDTKRHDCYLLGCETPGVCIRVRRLGDMYCVCGKRYGFGAELVYRAATNRWYHASCVAVAAAAPPLPKYGGERTTLTGSPW
jgi:hypothetical protein